MIVDMADVGIDLTSIFSERELKFMFAMSSSVRLSSVTLVLYSADWNFRQCLYAMWYPGHPWPLHKNSTEIVPGEPLRWGLNRRGVAKYNQCWFCRICLNVIIIVLNVRCISQGSIKTPFKGDRRFWCHFVTHLLGYMCTNIYSNRERFDKVIAKIKWCGFLPHSVGDDRFRGFLREQGLNFPLFHSLALSSLIHSGTKVPCQRAMHCRVVCVYRWWDDLSRWNEVEH